MRTSTRTTRKKGSVQEQTAATCQQSEPGLGDRKREVFSFSCFVCVRLMSKESGRQKTEALERTRE